MSIQSVVTPATNGTSAPVAKATKGLAKTRDNFKVTATSTTAMTAAQAVEAAFEYGASMAGMDGNLTRALIAFKDDETVQTDMLEALNVGYVMRKLGYDKEKATEVVRLLQYNEKKQDDHHRTFDQQRVMDTVRVMWHRAQKMAGITKPKSEKQIKAEVTRAQKESERKDYEAKREEAWDIVHPKEDVDVDEAMTRLVSTMKAYHSKHAAKFTGNKGSAWRDWLARAPK